MVAEQGRRQVGNVGTELYLALAQPLDQARSQYIRDRVERCAALQRRAHGLGLRLGSRTVRADAGQLGRQFGELLGGQHRIVLADEEIVFGTEVSDARFGFAHLVAQFRDLGLEPFSGVGIRFQLRGALHRDIFVGDCVRHLGGELRVLRRELDDQHAGLLDAVDLELLAESAQNALLRRNLAGVALETGKDQGPAEHGRLGIELIAAGKIELQRDLLKNVRGGDDLDLRDHALLVEDRPVAIRIVLGPGKDRFACLDEDAGLGRVFRCRQGDADKGDRRQRQRHDGDTPPVPRDARKELTEVDIDIICCGTNA